MSGYQVMPRLTPDEYADLEASIVRDGVLVPIIVSSGGEIVDGHHRAEIARKHGIVCAEVVKSGDATELRTFAYSLNLNRRHLTREQKRDLIADSLRADPQLSNNSHAKRVGASDKTVGGVRDEMEKSSEIPNFSNRTDPRTGNQSQPATKFGRPKFEPDDAIDANGVEDEAESAPKKDSVPARETHQKPRRKPYLEDLAGIVHYLSVSSQRLAALLSAERFEANAEQVAAENCNDLLRIIDVLQDAINQL